MISHIKVGSDLKKNIEKQSHLHANTVEAIIGALYIDRGYDAVFSFVEKLWSPLLREMISPPQDAKSVLQELMQKQKKEIPIYTLIEKTGKEHSPVFTVEVSAIDKKAIGKGSTKKEAEQSSAEKLLAIL